MYRGQDPGARFFELWEHWKDAGLEWPRSEPWESLYRSGIALLEMFASEQLIHIAYPERHLQVEASKMLVGGRRFVGIIDAIGLLDGRQTVIDWKTAAMRMSAETESLACLDPQLFAYAWLTGIRNVAFVVFVRKKQPEIQYITATVSERQIADWEEAVSNNVGCIEAGVFPPHLGIRFPNNACTGCPHLGLCLGKDELVRERLVQIGAGQLDWCDELAY